MGSAGGATCPAVHLSGSKLSKISHPGCPERREDVNPGPRLLLLQSGLKPSDSWAVPRIMSKSPQDGGGGMF